MSVVDADKTHCCWWVPGGSTGGEMQRQGEMQKFSGLFFYTTQQLVVFCTRFALGIVFPALALQPGGR